MGARMGLTMMSLGTYMLNSAPRELTSRVTSLSQALQNVVSSLAIATFATILQGRMTVHIAAAAAAVGGQPTGPALAQASALAFGDVYRVALGAIVVAWLLAWTLRPRQTAVAPSAPGAPARPVAEPEREREPVIAGHM
jgi:hypothetical protein